MPLNTIRTEIASDLGIKIDSTNQRDYLDAKINRAAKEIWDTFDLRNSLREQIFLLETSQQLITLPFYVYRLRKVRSYDYVYPIRRLGMAPRYHYNNWQPPFLQWRTIREEAPLGRDIENQGLITLTLSAAATVAVVFYIIGKTPNSQKVQEPIIFSVGDTAKTTVNQYEDIETIAKNKVIDQDCTITDMDGNTIAALPNSELKTSYTVVQVLDRYQVFDQTPLTEVLYKARFTPFKNDNDQFPCGEQFDDAIYWKTIELLSAKKEGEDAIAKTLGANAKCRSLVDKIEAINYDGEAQPVNFAPCPYYNLFTDYPFEYQQALLNG